jgi:hypothetical protein
MRQILLRPSVAADPAAHPRVLRITASLSHVGVLSARAFAVKPSRPMVSR